MILNIINPLNFHNKSLIIDGNSKILIVYEECNREGSEAKVVVDSNST